MARAALFALSRSPGTSDVRSRSRPNKWRLRNTGVILCWLQICFKLAPESAILAAEFFLEWLLVPYRNYGQHEFESSNHVSSAAKVHWRLHLIFFNTTAFLSFTNGASGALKSSVAEPVEPKLF